MGCGELLSYVEQCGDDGIGALVLVDGIIPARQNPEIVSVLADWTILLQQDRQKEADVFVRTMYKKPQPEDYIQRVKQATLKVPTDTAVALIYNMISVTDFSDAFARINRPMLFAYRPASQPSTDFLKAKLGDKVRLEWFDEDGQALFVDDPVKFNHMVDDLVQSLPKR
jgi:non-heme chloroperoxidase